MQTTGMSESMIAIRRAFPRLRRTSATAIIHSGGKQTIFGCLCGAKHTCATDWNGRDSKHVAVWCREHEACADAIAARLAKGETVEVCWV